MEIKNSESFKLCKQFLGKEVLISFDRPLGSKHPKYGFTYELNYGYIKGVKAPDREYLDAYYIGTDKPLKKITGIVKAIIHRLENDDDKLVVMPKKLFLSKHGIERAVDFQEKWFKHQIIVKNIVKDWQKTEKILKNDGVVILPTDTIYGIVGRASSKKVVERIYKIKGRDEKKPFIVLISSYKDLKMFGIKIGENQAKILEKFWPGKVTVILTCPQKKFEYLHRGSQSIAFRMIGQKNKNLFNLIKKVGPLVAPSANPSDLKHAETIAEAKKYFNHSVDFYINGGKKKGKSSTLVRFDNDKLIVLRQGEVLVK